MKEYGGDRLTLQCFSKLFERKVSEGLDVDSKEQSAKLGVDKVKMSTESDTW